MKQIRKNNDYATLILAAIYQKADISDSLRVGTKNAIKIIRQISRMEEKGLAAVSRN